MTWTPKYQAQFGEPVVRQILALIQRDQRAALDYVGAQVALTLPDFVTFQMAPLSTPQFPAVLVWAGNAINLSPDTEGALHYGMRLFVSMLVGHQDPETLAVLARAYLEVMILLVLSAPLTDFYLALPLTMRTLNTVTTTPLAAGSVMELIWNSFDVNQIQNPKTGGFQCAVTADFVIELQDVQNT